MEVWKERERAEGQIAKTNSLVFRCGQRKLAATRREESFPGPLLDLVYFRIILKMCFLSRARLTHECVSC